MTILSFRLIVTSCALKIDVHPTSHILPIYTGELCVSLGKICPPYALSDKAGKSSKHGFIDCMVWTFGHPTLMGGTIFLRVIMVHHIADNALCILHQTHLLSIYCVWID